jgi:hypothetical protein
MMMKKLLVLALVLSVAGLANAGFSASYDGSKVSISNDEGIIGGIANCIGIQIVGAGVGTTLATDAVTWRTVDMPDGDKLASLYTSEDTALGSTTANAWELPRFNGGMVYLQWANVGATTAGIPSPAGFWVSMPLAGYTLGTAQNAALVVELTDGSGNNMQSLYLVPEPMTMVLLGLGGLFLRKKK